MKEQVTYLTSIGLSACYLDGKTDAKDPIWSQVERSEYGIVFVTPEMFILSLRFRKILQSDYWQQNCVACVVDEADCICSWYMFMPMIIVTHSF